LILRAPDYEVRAGRDVLGGPVLVLNRFYLPVHVVSVRRSLVMLYRDLAEVIHVAEGQYFNYDFAGWLELAQLYATLPPGGSAAAGGEGERTTAADRETGGNDDRELVRGGSFSIEAPRVVRLTRYDRVPRQGVRFNRRNLLARDNHQCQFCGQSFANAQLSMDHIVPRSRGGLTTWENVVCSCLRCNSRKGNRTPEEANMRLLRNPVRPRQNPLMVIRPGNPRYESWRPFLGNGAG
jgi:5-methylcytosine-specific restriction endonuclease McrA